MSKPMALWQKWAITSPLRLIKTCESHAKAFFCPHPAQEIYRLLRPYSVLHLIETHRVIFWCRCMAVQWDPVIQLHGAPGRTPSLWTVRVLSLPLWQEQSWISAAEAQIAVLSADSFRDGWNLVAGCVKTNDTGVGFGILQKQAWNGLDWFQVCWRGCLVSERFKFAMLWFNKTPPVYIKTYGRTTYVLNYIIAIHFISWLVQTVLLKKTDPINVSCRRGFSCCRPRKYICMPAAIDCFPWHCDCVACPC